jgi:hypothetical protein
MKQTTFLFCIRYYFHRMSLRTPGWSDDTRPTGVFLLLDVCYMGSTRAMP